MGSDAAVPPKQPGRIEVDPFLGMEQAGSVDSIWISEDPSYRVAGDAARHRHRVAAVVEHGAARERPAEVVRGGGRRAGVEAPGQGHHAQVADLAALEQLGKAGRLRVDSEGERLHQEHARQPCGLDGHRGARGRDRDRLFAQDVLARRCGRGRELRV